MSSSTSYEEWRALTALFFLEKLLTHRQGEASRTLHDLSCQFGNSHFTKEMRLIAGGSKQGLRRFLSSYPSLFEISAERVSLTPLPALTRSPEQMAAVFFRQKLRNNITNEDTGMALHSLLGHRSQASEQVRHVCGQNIEEFGRFLQNFPQIFVLHDDNQRVRLTHQGRCWCYSPTPFKPSPTNLTLLPDRELHLVTTASSLNSLLDECFDRFVLIIRVQVDNNYVGHKHPIVAVDLRLGSQWNKVQREKHKEQWDSGFLGELLRSRWPLKILLCDDPIDPLLLRRIRRYVNVFKSVTNNSFASDI